MRFLSTLSLRRATVTVLGIQHKVGISIHALLAESDTDVSYLSIDNSISIHALLAESDAMGAIQAHNQKISIHALLAESDVPRTKSVVKHGKFLSTLSLRRATQTLCDLGGDVGISIHALLAESDAHVSASWSTR